jgi:hypothetical protein
MPACCNKQQTIAVRQKKKKSANENTTTTTTRNSNNNYNIHTFHIHRHFQLTFHQQQMNRTQQIFPPTLPSRWIEHRARPVDDRHVTLLVVTIVDERYQLFRHCRLVVDIDLVCVITNFQYCKETAMSGCADFFLETNILCSNKYCTIVVKRAINDGGLAHPRCGFVLCGEYK